MSEGIYTCIYCGKKLTGFNCGCVQKRENSKLWNNPRKQDRVRLNKTTTKGMLPLKDTQQDLKGRKI